MLVAVVMASPLFASPPEQDAVSVVLGPKAYRDGDVIQITDVTATSPKLEQGDTVKVKGRVRLDSREEGRLCLLLTQTRGDGSEETDVRQSVIVKRGLAEFELEITIKHQGVLHLTFYDQTSSKAFGGTYFGTRDQMREIADWDLSYYLKHGAAQKKGNAALEIEVLQAEQNLLRAKERLKFSERLFAKGYAPESQVEIDTLAVEKAQRELEGINTKLKAID